MQRPQTFPFAFWVQSKTTCSLLAHPFPVLSVNLPLSRPQRGGNPARTISSIGCDDSPLRLGTRPRMPHPLERTADVVGSHRLSLGRTLPDSNGEDRVQGGWRRIVRTFESRAIAPILVWKMASSSGFSRVGFQAPSHGRARGLPRRCFDT